MRRGLWLALTVAAALLATGTSIAQTCLVDCGECGGGSFECLGLEAGSACSVAGRAGTCTLFCPSEGDCCACDTTVPPQVPASSATGLIVLTGLLGGGSAVAALRRG